MTAVPLIDASSVILHKNEPAFNAVKIIDASDGKIALIINDNGKLIGSATDGDIRRGLLKGFNLTNKISEFMQDDPVVLPATANRHKILDKMAMLDVQQIPLVCDDGKIIGITTYNLLQRLAYSPRKNSVVIMAGGKGKRLMPITKDIPKSMVEINGSPILEFIIQRFREYGFQNFYIAINYLGNIIEDYFGDGSNFGVNITYLREQQELGTAGALSLLDKKINDDFIVINGDILSSVNFSDMLDTHLVNANTATIFAKTNRMQVPYGVLCTNANGYVENIVEKPVYEYLISAGIYVISPTVLSYIKTNSYTDMPDLLMCLIQSKNKVGTYTSQDEWIDIGKHDDLERARKAIYSSDFKLRHC